MRRRITAGWFLFVLCFLSTSIFYVGRYQFRNSVLQNATKLKRLATNSVKIESTSTDRVRFLSKRVTKSLAELGKTPELSAHLLFFNRVPKCGSEMFVLLMQWLQGPNNFRHYRLKDNVKRKLSEKEQEELVHEVADIVRNKAVPLTFDRHVYFINFTSFGVQSPTYINIIRDPVDKIISRFYYKRVTPNLQSPDMKWAPKKTKNFDNSLKHFEDCVRMQNPECTYTDGLPYDLTIPYFCGQDPRCMLLNDPWATAMAKSNVERYFSVVGVLEELNATLEILEHKHPYFFKGVQHVYFKDLFQPHYNKNLKKPNVESDVIKYIRSRFVREYDFYEWIQSRLFQQLQTMYGHNH